MVASHAELHNKNSEHDEVRGIICFARRTNHTITGLNCEKNNLIIHLSSHFSINEIEAHVD